MDKQLLIQIAAEVFSILVGIVSYKRNSVSVSGLMALLIISGLFIWMYEIALLIVIFAMFASSSLLSHFKKPSKKEFDLVVSKTGPRDYIQALANLGIATLLLILYHFMKYDFMIVALVGSVAAANGDSWASEIGGITKKKPVLITNLKPVEKGISGGITYAGTIGGILGSLFIVCIAVSSFNFFQPFMGNITFLFWSSFIAGFIGLLADSYLGATAQALYKNPDNNSFTENEQPDRLLVKGIRWIDNDMVNFLTTIIGAIAAGVIYCILKNH